MSDTIKDFINLAKNINQVNEIPKNISLISNKYDKLFSLIRQYVSKLIICTETTLYKILNKSNILINIKYSTSFKFINSLLSNHFNLTYHMIHMKKYNCKYFESMSNILQESKLHVLHRVIYIVVDFYSAINRSKLNINSFEEFVESVSIQFDEIFDSMKPLIYKNFANSVTTKINEYVKEYNPFDIQFNYEYSDELDIS